MVCDKCGTEVTKNDKLCPKCGAEVLKGKKKKTEMLEVEEYKLKDKEIEKLTQSFASRDEKYIASLGNGYIMNYLTNKSLKKGFAFLTDKRVYFKGSCFSGKGKSLVKTDEERTVDVKNITGSGFIYRRYWGILIALFISILATLAGTIVGTWNGVGNLKANTNRWDRYQAEIRAIEEEIDRLHEPDWGEELESKIFINGTFIGLTLSVHSGSDELDIEIEGDYEDIHDVQSAAINLCEQEIERIKNRMGMRPILRFLVEVIPAGLCLSLALICCIGIKNYLLKRKTLFRIEYAGGCIAFDVSFYAKAEIDDFQKQLRRVKDFAEETATIKTVAVETPTQAPTQNSVPDELRKYADLLKEGLISQEEYEALKKKILGL